MPVCTAVHLHRCFQFIVDLGQRVLRAHRMLANTSTCVWIPCTMAETR